jgi:trans-aconitate methyltransferase
VANFDKAYYQRFYENAETQAVSREEQIELAQFIAAYLRYLNVPVTSVLDVGCGLGQVLDALATEFPKARTQGVEVSSYLCETYGWHHANVQDFRAPPSDLVICNDVLGYLSKKAVREAVKNLARLTTSTLYLSVLTEEDQAICDQEHTDLDQKIRPAQWYKNLLDKYFVGVGGGLFLKKPLAYPVWQMERT